MVSVNNINKPNKTCENHEVSGCERLATIEVLNLNGRVVGVYCSKDCANEYIQDSSNGAWLPFPDLYKNEQKEY